MKAPRFSWFADLALFASLFGVQFNSGTDPFADRVAAQRLFKKAKQSKSAKQVNRLPTVGERDPASIAMWTVVIGVLAFLAGGAVLAMVPAVAHAEPLTAEQGALASATIAATLKVCKIPEFQRPERVSDHAKFLEDAKYYADAVHIGAQIGLAANIDKTQLESDYKGVVLNLKLSETACKAAVQQLDGMVAQARKIAPAELEQHFVEFMKSKGRGVD